MTYYYRPGGNGVRRPNRAMPRAIHSSPRTPRALPKIPWRIVGISTGILILAGLGWFGVTKIQGWSARRSAAAETARAAADQKRLADLESSISAQITTPMGGTALWEQMMKEGKTDEALMAAKITLKLQPNWRDGYLMLASSQIAGKNYLEAEGSLLKALDIDPIYPTTHQLLATLYEATDKKAEAAQETEKATSLAEKTGTPIGG